MNRYEQHPEQIYECRQCGQLYPESTVITRPTTKTRYCRICQSEELRLVIEDDALNQTQKQTQNQVQNQCQNQHQNQD